MRRLLPPSALAITPSDQRRVDGRSKADLDALLTAAGLPLEPAGFHSARAIINSQNAQRTIDTLFTSKDETMAERRRKTTATLEQATREVDDLIAMAPAQEQATAPATKPLPELRPELYSIQESLFSMPVDGLYDRLVGELSVSRALTPGVLAEASNQAETNALDAMKLYLVARADFERFERECDPVFESMRDAANRDLQAEKDKGMRSKAITDADIRGRAAIMFPDEWKRITDRKVKAEAMLDLLKKLAGLWEQRCFTLGTMTNAGKRS